MRKKSMNEPNTLFLIAKHGLNKGDEPGLLETWMWNLTSEEESMSYISLHKTKGDRAHKGGLIVGFRDATDDEVEKHRELLRKLDKPEMKETSSRRIVVFRPDVAWNKLWPSDAKSNPMTYKSIGYVQTNA